MAMRLDSGSAFKKKAAAPKTPTPSPYKPVAQTPAYVKKTSAPLPSPYKPVTQAPAYVKKNTPAAAPRVASPAPVARATAPAPRAPVAQAPAASRSAASYSGGALGTSDTGVVGESAAPVEEEIPAPVPMSDDDWWNQDASFQTESGGLKSVLDNALSDLARKRSNYDTDFSSTLKNLGWDWEGDTIGDLGSVGAGKWDPTNQLGAYGQGNQNLTNDYASRGLMDSSFFGDALTNYNTDFNNQFANLNQGRAQFQTEYGDNTGQGASANSEYQNALQRARQSSLARRDIAI